MEHASALHILRTLAQGIDPHTGVVFPADSPYQHPDTVRALFQAAQALTEPPVPRTRPSSTSPAVNAGKPWTDDEDRTLAADFDAGQAVPALAAAHGRSRAAIQARLIKLGKLEPTPDLPRFGRLAAQAAAASGN